MVNLPEEIEQAFQPKPGGMVDTLRKQRAQAEADAQQAEHEREEIQERASKAVKVAVESPEQVSATTFNLAPGGSALILPASDFRSSAKILVNTSGGEVYLSPMQNSAEGSYGFLLPAGLLLPVSTRGLLYAANPGATAVQVSVIAESYAVGAITPTASHKSPHHWL
jgi:hypothetical protein